MNFDDDSLDPPSRTANRFDFDDLNDNEVKPPPESFWDLDDTSTELDPITCPPLPTHTQNVGGDIASQKRKQLEDAEAQEAAIAKLRLQAEKVAHNNLGAKYVTNLQKQIAAKTKERDAHDESRLNEIIGDYCNSLLKNKSDDQANSLHEVQAIIRKISNGELVSLNLPSLNAKRQLLQCAVSSSDGVVITRVALYIWNTLNERLAVELLQSQPISISHLINYFKTREQHNHLLHVLEKFDKRMDYTMELLKCAFSLKDIVAQINALEDIRQKCLSKLLVIDSMDLEMVIDQILLLKKQLIVERDDLQQVNAAVPKNQVLKKFPPTTNLFGQSLSQTIFYLAFYHFSENDSDSVSLDKWRSQFKVSEKMHLWNVLKARAKLSAWQDIEIILTQKAILGFGSPRLKCAIGFGNVARILKNVNAPAEYVKRYILLIPSVEERLDWANRLPCALALVHIHISKKDRQGLLSLRPSLKQGSKELYDLNNALDSSSSIKWKN